MREKSVVSYGYLAESCEMTSKHRFIPSETAAIMNYSTFEEHFLGQRKGSSKCSVRRRVEKARNCRYSDVESDTGSDGLAVNSGGSGRSGDWGPPKRQSKQRGPKCRSDSKPSLTDSGISLSKADSESYSELSCQRLNDDFIVHCPNDVTHNDRSCESFTHKSPNKVVTSNNLHQRNLLRRTHSCSALPSNIKPLDKHNPRISTASNVGVAQRHCSDIEQREDSILRQCYRNEGITEYSDDKGHSYVFDCSRPLAQSKFPLPEHLNYPLCKYRYKSESILSRTSMKPLKKIKDGWRKLKSRSLSQDKSVERSRTLPLDSSCLDYLHESDEDSDDILSRLATVPKEKKSFLKKLINRIGPSQTYKAQDISVLESEISTTDHRFQRSASTRSIPEALRNMWSKVHEVDFEQVVSPSVNTLSRAFSMPSISANHGKSELRDEVFYFNEPGLRNSETNYFSNFFKPMETKSQCKTRNKISGGDDIITGVLGMQKESQVEAKETLHDFSSEIDSLDHTNERKPVAGDLPKKIVAARNDISTDDLDIELGQQTTSHDMHSSCYELHSDKSYFYDPQKYYSPYMVRNTHCNCCMHNQLVPIQYNTSYPQPNYIYEVANNHDTSRQNLSSVREEITKRDNVVAPLDIQISCERKAERRKISDMIFDTFV